MLGTERDYVELVWRGLVRLLLALWGVWARLVNRLPESFFSPAPAPVEMPVLEKPTDEEIANFKKAIDRRKTFHEEISKTIKWTLYTLIATCLFCVVTLFGTSDAHLLTPDSKVELPILNYPMSFGAFLVVGPIVLIGLTTYLHIFVGQQRIATVPREDQFATLTNFDSRTSQLVVILLLYWMVPLTLSEFAWKAKPRSDGLVIYSVACVVAVGLGHLQFRRCPKELRTRGIAVLLCAVVLYLSYTTVRVWNRHLSLFKADLSEQDLRGANLELAFLSEANLVETNLNGANLQGADLRRARLQEADLGGANLQEADLSGANLLKAKLRSANLQRADFGGANLQRANLIRANLQGADLRRARLQEADLGGANLQEADLGGADLQGVDLGSANLQEAKIFNAKLQKADLGGANLQGAFLRRANLQGADLGDANLRETDLRSTNLQGADLRSANLQEANLRRANLQGADLGDANLRETDLRSTNLQGADLRSANLQEANLFAANLQGADFSLATLTKVPHKNPLTRGILMGKDYAVFQWPPSALSGAFYIEGYPPNIDPSLLVLFTAVGDDCTWVTGLKYVDCAGYLPPLGR